VFDFRRVIVFKRCSVRFKVLVAAQRISYTHSSYTSNPGADVRLPGVGVPAVPERVRHCPGRSDELWALRAVPCGWWDDPDASEPPRQGRQEVGEHGAGGGGDRDTLRTMAWTADRDISHSRHHPIAATAAASASS